MQSDNPGRSEQAVAWRKERPIHLILLIAVSIYAIICGLRTVADFDLGWQMAEARSGIASVDTLSYTAHGAPWIYPPLSGIVFKHFFETGGYEAISWLCAIALVITAFIIAWGSKIPTLLLTMMAMPVLANQMIPRSGLFTVVIAAMYTRLLLSWHRGGQSYKLWVLPLLMILWVNLHTGFIAGIGLLLGYAMVEGIDMLVAAKRRAAISRLKRAAPWLLATIASTLINPWGARIYVAIHAQEHVSKLQAMVIEELAPLNLHFTWQRLNPLDPLGATCWMLVLALAGVVLLVRQRRLGQASFLFLAMVACLFSARSQGVFYPIACLLGGDALHVAMRQWMRADPAIAESKAFALRWAVVSVVTGLAIWHGFDIVTERASLREEQITAFGTGPSWWLPKDAADFIERHHLPTEVFSTLNLSSYLTWRLGPQDRDFADGRYLPFGDTLIEQQMQLASLPLDSAEWQRAASRYNIRTVIFPLSRFFGFDGVPLRQDCASRTWAPVYLDTKAIVLVRGDALSASDLADLRIDCQKQSLVLSGERNRSRLACMEHYQSLANAATIYFLLGRNEEAKTSLHEARSISKDDSSMDLLDGQLKVESGNTAAAEVAFRRAIQLRESDAAWYRLGILYANEHRYPEGILAIKHAAELAAPNNLNMQMQLAKLQILNGEDGQALRTLERARRNNPYPGQFGAEVLAQINETEATAYSQLAEWNAAIAAEEMAVRAMPASPRSWQILAALYRAAGERDPAAHAMQHAETLIHQQR